MAGFTSDEVSFEQRATGLAVKHCQLLSAGENETPGGREGGAQSRMGMAPKIRGQQLQCFEPNFEFYEDCILTLRRSTSTSKNNHSPCNCMEYPVEQHY